MRLFTLLTALILASALCAQETRNSISGRVTDPQGSPVAGADVVVTNTDTNTATRMASNETGFYQATLLLPGHYTVTVEAAGFKKAVRSGIVLEIGGIGQIPMQLELGSVAESVVVTAAAPLLDTAQVNAGRVLSNKELMDLPVMVNNVMLLVRQVPGIQTSGVNQYDAYNSIPDASSFKINSGVGGNLFTLDGAIIPGPNRATGYLPHSDTLEEFRVETSNFDASNGHSTGAVVVMMTKAGTNDFHGTATEQHWEQRWNGTPFFVKQNYFTQINTLKAQGNLAAANALAAQDKQPSGHSNNYAVTLGGPILIPKLFNGKNKLFFFFSFNGTKTNQTENASNLNRTVPTLPELKGDFSDLLKVNAATYQIYDPLSVQPDSSRAGHFVRSPMPGNIIPASRIINPIYNAYAKFFPAPNNNPASPTQDPTNNYIAAGQPWNSSYHAITNRTDYQLSDRNRFFARWNYNLYAEDRGDWTFTTERGLATGGTVLRNRGTTVDWTYTATPHTVFNFSASANENRSGVQIPVPASFTAADVGLPAYIDQKVGAYTMLPQVSIAGGYSTLGANNYPFFQYYRYFNGKADVSHLAGKHSLQAGFDAASHVHSGGPSGTSSGAFSFSNTYTKKNDDNFTPAQALGLSWADFMMGLPDTMSIATNSSFLYGSPFYGAYVQDSWRIHPRLTLNLGLRAEYERGPTERYNRMIGAFDPTATLPITAGAEAAYAKNPIPELPAANFVVLGGSLYTGVGGVSPKLIDNNMAWLPRVGASFQVNSKTVIRGGYGIYTDTFNTFDGGPDQSGFSRPTSTVVTNDFGVHWLVGNPGAGVSPLTDPFPVRSSTGTRFDQPPGNALGLMAKTGGPWGYTDFNMHRARQQRWQASIQRQLGSHMVVEAAYAGSYSDRIPILNSQDALPGQYWSTGNVRNNALASNLSANVTNPFQIANFASLAQSNPLIYQNMQTLGFFNSATIAKNQLLLPFPQMTVLNDTTTPLGKARTNALIVSFQRRFSKGVSINFGYTRLSDREATSFFNPFDAEPIWLESGNGRPHRVTGSAIWDLPFGKGRSLARSGIANLLFGGFQIAATYEYQPGPLLQFPNTFYYGSNLSDIANGPHTLSQWFNTANFETNATKAPDAFHVRSFPNQVAGVRADMTNQWNANVQREFVFRERFRLQVRMEALNLQNRSQFNAPIVNPIATNFGTVVSQSAATNRFLQIQGRIRF